MDSTKTAELVERSAKRERLTVAERAFLFALRRLEGGSLQVRFPGGAERLVGDRAKPPVRMEICRPAFFSKVLSGGSVGLGESYVDGDWTTPELSALLGLLGSNQQNFGIVRRGLSLLTRGMNRFGHRARRNTIDQSKQNIQAHYDLSNAFYACFLDSGMVYSSARFEAKDEPLARAQERKIDRMLDLAGVGQGDSILEIGSGWGALALRAAQRGCRVKTITLSQAQYDYASALFCRAGVEDRVTLRLEDYRKQTGEYDAVLSCEMIEAVGHEYLPGYFKVVSDCLKPKARAVIQAITIPDERYASYVRSCDWIQKHIFPGGHLPSPGAIRKHVSATGQACITSMEGFGRDYAETLRRWAKSFNQAEEKIAGMGFDEAFRRKWNYYLSYCEAGFDAGLIDVQHVVLERT